MIEVNLVDSEDDASIRQQCIDLLRSLVPDVSDERADQLLRSVSPQDDLTLWCEAAIIQMAVDNEVEDEAEELSKAMQESLEEAQVRKDSEIPLEESSWDEIQGFFSSSEFCQWVSTIFSENSSIRVCFEEDEQLKKSLVRFLRMEKKCKQWYPQSSPYFSRLLERINVIPDHDKDFLGKLYQSIEDEMQVLEGAVFAFPASGNPIPTIFCDNGKPEVVDLL